jgi:hypothetical protein
MKVFLFSSVNSATQVAIQAEDELEAMKKFIAICGYVPVASVPVGNPTERNVTPKALATARLGFGFGNI